MTNDFLKKSKIKGTSSGQQLRVPECADFGAAGSRLHEAGPQGASISSVTSVGC